MTDNIKIDDSNNVIRTIGTFEVNGIHLLRQIIVDRNNRVLHLDQVSGCLPTIDTNHQEMHEGNHYFVKTYVANTGGAASSNYFSFTTPDNLIRVHAKGMLAPDSDFIVDIFEDAIISAGTTITAQNCDRNSSNTTASSLKLDPTITDEGTLFWSGRTGGGQIKLGVFLDFNYEFILKQNATYLIKITKVLATAGVVDVDLFWYEHIALF